MSAGVSTLMGGFGSGRNPKEYEEFAKALEEALNKPSKFAEYMIGIEPFDYQRKFLDDPSRFKMFVGGRKVGKTTMTAILAIYHALTRSEAEVLIIAPTFRQSGILFDKIRDMLENSNMLGTGLSLSYLFVRRMTRTMIEFINDSRIYSLPAGVEGRTIRGFTPSLMIFDEAAYIRDEVYTAVMPSGLASKAEVIMISTPAGKQGYFYEAFISGRWSVHRATSFDNPLVKDDPAFAEEIKTLTKDAYRQEVLGEFVEYGRAFFSRDEVLRAVSDNVLVDGAPILSVDVARYGADETVIALAYRKGRELFVREFWAYPHTAITQIADIVEELATTYSVRKIYVDETGLGGGLVDILKERALPVVGVTFTNKKKLEMYRELKLMFEQNRIRIPGDQKLIKQLLAIEVETTQAGNVVFRSSEHDDYVDAIALLTNAFGKGRTRFYLLDPSVIDAL